METRIPFQGFYGSLLDGGLDRCIEQEVEHLQEKYEGFEPGELSEIVYRHANFSIAHQQVARDYAGAFQDYLKDEHGVDVALKFVEMTSPKEYNFTTDNIYCEISRSDVLKLLKLATWKATATAARELFTSRSGFISFYDPDIRTWGKVAAWDCNQVYAILVALVGDQDSNGESLDMNMYYRLDIDSAFDKCLDYEAIEYDVQDMIHAEENPADELYYLRKEPLLEESEEGI